MTETETTKAHAEIQIFEQFSKILETTVYYSAVVV